MTDTVILTGIFSLAGVIIGAFTATGTQLYLDNKREKRSVQRAARLIDADLLMATTAAKISITKKAWWVDDRILTTDGWLKNRDIIASKLSWNDWVAVLVAVQAVSDLQQSRDVAKQIQRGRASTSKIKEERDVLLAADRLGLSILDPTPPITNTTVKQIKVVQEHLNAGRAALASLVGK